MTLLFLVTTFFFQAHLLDAFAKSDVETIQNSLESTVLININDDIDFYQKKEAAAVLSDFFTTNQPKSYKESFRETKAGNNLFVNADLYCNTGKYRLNLLINNDGKNEMISEIKIFKN